MKQDYKNILKRENINGKDMALYLGLKYGSYRAMIKETSLATPKWLKAFVMAYKLGQKSMKL
jgi:hypothetical protein